MVTESNKNSVSIFSPAGKKLRSFGSYGSGQGYFSGTRGVAVDDDGNILVSDYGSDHIQKFTANGKFITTIGREGKNPLEFSIPLGISTHPLNKKVYIVENSNHCIQVLNPDLTFFSRFGSFGSNNGQFQHPWDVACDSTGNVYVADYSNNRIQVFTAEGQFLRKFRKKGSGNGELSNPSGICINNEDVVFVTENTNRCVSVFTCEGKFLTSFGTRGNGPGQFNQPRGIAVDKDGVIYVSDSGNNRLQLF